MSKIYNILISKILNEIIPASRISILKGNKIFVTHFSIHDEKRLAYHTKDEQSDIAYWHDPKNELQILRWLHESKYIDATLCMLEDKKIPTLKLNFQIFGGWVRIFIHTIFLFFSLQSVW